MLHNLLADRVVRVSGLVYAVVMLPFLLPAIDSEWLLEFANNYTHLLLIIVTLVALLHGMGACRQQAHRRFWLAIAAAYIAWLGVRVLYLAVPEDTGSSLLAADGLYLCYYAGLLVAVSFRPHLAQAATTSSAGRWIEVLGTLLFAFGLLIYFVFIPASEDRSQHLESITPFLMFGVFNLLLLGTLLALWHATDAASYWRWVYGLLALNVAAWSVLDVIEGAIEAKAISAVDAVSLWDTLWLLPYALVIVAACVGVVSAPATAQRMEVAPIPQPQEQLWGTGRLLAFAVTLPALHLGLVAIGFQNYEASRTRAACAATTLVVLGALAFVQQRYSSGQRDRAVRDLARREKQLRRSQKLEVVGKLAAGIAHEFNNLLVPVRAFTELALDQTPKRSEVADDLHQVLEATARATGLAKQLLVFSRHEPPELSDLALNDLTANISRLLDRLMGHGIKPEFRIAPVVDNVWADASQIEQVIMNLAINARDAMPGGGVLTIETSNLLVEEYDRSVEGLVPGRYVKISVSDTGCGMDQQLRDRVFEPFFTTKPGDQGTGLGLSICHDIVQAHGGHIDLQSTPGEGTTVSILLKSSGESVLDAAT